jgi:hypothetical protein
MNITPQWIFNNLSRSFYHSLQGINLLKENQSPERFNGWVVDQDFIPRKSSTASVVIQGVKPGENVEMTTMWTVLGYPPAGIAIPLWIKVGENQPSVVVSSAKSEPAPACDKALALKYKTFSLKRGNGGKYMNFNLIYNSENKGYMQELRKPEESIYQLFKSPIEKWREKGLNLEELKSLYSKVDVIVNESYRKLSINN